MLARPEPVVPTRLGPGPGDAGDLALRDVDVIRVRGGARLAGTVHVVGAKNSA